MKRFALAVALSALAWNGAIAQECSSIAEGSDVSQIGACFEAMSSTITNLEASLTEARGENAAINRLLSDAVLAFNRSEKDGACPLGWSLFDDAGGRFIIGAGAHQNPGLRTYLSFADDEDDATGGEETVTLTVPQMPQHAHSFASEVGADGNRSGRQDATFGRTTASTGAAGGNQPHANMPPYIALYFCQKD